MDISFMPNSHKDKEVETDIFIGDDNRTFSPNADLTDKEKEELIDLVREIEEIEKEANDTNH